MSFRPTHCVVCGKPLPIAHPTGRPRRYCSDTCRYAAKNRRLVIPIPPRDERDVRRRILAEAVASVLDSEPAAPEDRLTTVLLELEHARGQLRTIGPDLAPPLRARASGLAEDLDSALDRHFREVVNA